MLFWIWVEVYTLLLECKELISSGRGRKRKKKRERERERERERDDILIEGVIKY